MANKTKNARYEVHYEDKRLRQFLLSSIKRWKMVENKDDKYIRTILSANIIQDVADHFENQDGGPRIGPWPEWSRIYSNHMRSIGKQGNNILVDSGRLKNTFRTNKYRKNPASVTFYNNAKTKGGFPYAAAHNSGGPHLKRRRFMWLSLEARQKIAKETLLFISRQYKKT